MTKQMVLLWVDGLDDPMIEWFGEQGQQPPEIEIDECHEWISEDELGEICCYYHGKHCNCSPSLPEGCSNKINYLNDDKEIPF